MNLKNIILNFAGYMTAEFRIIVVSVLFTACSEEPLWMNYINAPQEYAFEHHVNLVKSFAFEDIDAELLVQANGPGTAQRVLKVFPKEYDGKLPAVVVPFYFPEGMLAFELESLEPLPKYFGIEMMLHLAKRGFACISADSYHLTYLGGEKDSGDFTRWKDAGDAISKDWPQWCGMGKLVADTRLLIDLLEEDSRIDSSRIGISNIDLLSYSKGKPFFLIAGDADTDASYEAIKQAKGYKRHPERLGFLNHATGHRPTREALEAGYDFLERYL